MALEAAVDDVEKQAEPPVVDVGIEQEASTGNVPPKQAEGVTIVVDEEPRRARVVDYVALLAPTIAMAYHCQDRLRLYLVSSVIATCIVVNLASIATDYSILTWILGPGTSVLAGVGGLVACYYAYSWMSASFEYYKKREWLGARSATIVGSKAGAVHRRTWLPDYLLLVFLPGTITALHSEDRVTIWSVFVLACYMFPIGWNDLDGTTLVMRPYSLVPYLLVCLVPLYLSLKNDRRLRD